MTQVASTGASPAVIRVTNLVKSALALLRADLMLTSQSMGSHQEIHTVPPEPMCSALRPFHRTMRPRRFLNSFHGRGNWPGWISFGRDPFSSRQMAQSSGVLGFSGFGVLVFFSSPEFSSQDPNRMVRRIGQMEMRMAKIIRKYAR